MHAHQNETITVTLKWLLIPRATWNGMPVLIFFLFFFLLCFSQYDFAQLIFFIAHVILPLVRLVPLPQIDGNNTNQLKKEKKKKEREKHKEESLNIRSTVSVD